METTKGRTWYLTSVVVGALVGATACGGYSSAASGSTSVVTYTGAVDGLSTTALTNEPGVAEATFQEPVGEVWAALRLVFVNLGIEPTVADRAAAVMGNPRFRPRRIENRRLSTFFDCGSGLTGDYADVYEVTMMINVQLTSLPAGGTTARTTVDAFAADRNTSGNSIHCRPRGSLERRVGELLGERLAGE